MDARNRFIFAAGLVVALAAGPLTLAAVRAEEGEDADALVKSHGDPDFAAREKAYCRLKELGAAAKEALGKGAASGDAQVRWASSRLLGLLDEGRRKGDGPPRLRFEEREEAGEEEPGIEGETGTGEPYPDLDRAFEDMRRRMAELQRRFEGLERRDPSPRTVPGEGDSVQRHVILNSGGERIEVRIGSDGKVAVTLTKRSDGAGKTESFEAHDVEAMEKEHPEIWAKVKGLVEEDGPVRIRLFGGPAPEFPPLPVPGLPLLERTRPGRSRPGTGEGGPVLGVTVGEIPEVLRAHVKIPAGEGLSVEEVLPGTPAERLGLRRFDLLLTVNGIPVSTAAEVRSAVGAVEEGGSLRLRILREGRESEVEGRR